MNLSDARTIARELMGKYNLNHIPFEFDGGKRRVGACWFRGDVAIKISLSRHMVLLNPEKIVRETILHEVAHVKAGRGAHHGPKWKAWAIAMGVDPSSKCGSEVAAPPHQFEATCKVCGKVFKRHRQPSRPLWCRCHGTFLPERRLVWGEVSISTSYPVNLPKREFSLMLTPDSLVAFNKGPLKGTRGRVVEIGKLIRVQMPSGIMAVPRSMLDIAE